MSATWRVGNVVVVLGLLTLAALGLEGAAAWAQEQPQPLSAQERQQLTKQFTYLFQQGVAHYQKAQVDEALRVMEQCLGLCRRLYPAAQYPNGYADLAGTLNALGFLHQARGDLLKAEPFYRDALAMNQQLYPKARYKDGHPDLAQSLNNLGMLLQARGEYAQAEPFYRDALAMCKQLYPKARFPDGHAHLALTLNNLGMLLKDRGEYAQAEPFYRAALVMLKQLYPDGHPDLATSLNNMGRLLQEHGEYAQAEPLLRDALAMRQQLYPKARYQDGHPHLAQSLNNLGMLLQDRGEYAQADSCLRDALVMCKQLYPKARYKDGHPELAITLSNLGYLLQARGEYAQAEPFYRDVLAMRQQLYPKARYKDGHPDLAQGLNNLGTLLHHRGEYAQAEPLYRDAFAMMQQLYSKARYKDGHPDLALSLNNLGRLLQDRGEYAQAEPFLRDALATYQRLGAAFAHAAAEAETLNLLASLPQSRDRFLSVTANLPGASPNETYTLLWHGKATLARLLEGRQRLFLTLPDAADRQRLHDLLAVRRDLARLVLRDAAPDQQRHRLLQQLTQRKEDLEKALASKLPQLQERTPPHTDLGARLPAHAAFVDVHRYLHLPKGAKTLRPHYVAFVLRKDTPVARVELGEAEPIEKALAAWRKDIGNGLDSKAATALRRQLWDKLAPHLPTQPGSTVYLCPDADLSALPWAALPGRTKGTILLEDHALALVPHGQALLDQLRPHATDRPATALLALGGPRFDKVPDPARRPDDLAAVRPAQRSNNDGVWPELPGSAREAGAIAALARSLPRPLKVLERSGSAASATQLYLDLPQVRWAHLATHGFFAAPESKERQYLFDEKEFRLGVQGLSGRERLGAGARHPLTQTGLVLAGANRRGKDASADGGILTAEAIAGLDLRKLELAVLSACETGLGEAAAGEGVFGLQRAFHLGGCRNVVASLWKVDDDATAALMNLFYYELWRKGQPPLQALRRAQLALYRHPGEVRTLATVRGPDFDKTVRRVTQPPRAGERPQRAALVRDWAAFLLSGSGR